MINRKLGVILLSALMLFTSANIALAAQTQITLPETDEKADEVSAFVTKKMVIPEGSAIPSATFKFQAEGVTSDAPTASIADISFGSTSPYKEVKAENGTLAYEFTEKAPVKFGTFLHAGVYEYTVKEVKDIYKGDGTFIYSDDIYTLSVYVANKSNGYLYVKSITAKKDNTKQPEIIFTNTFQKSASLTIEKKTEGLMADKSKAFDFTIKFSAPALSSQTDFSGNIDGEEILCTLDKEIPFKLKDGQKLVFKNLPVGTRYIVTEKGAEDGYTPMVSVIENGIKLEDKYTNECSDLSSVKNNPYGNLVGEKNNYVTFVNSHQDVPITGININNLPFFVMIAVTVIAFAALALFKRKRDSNT